MLSILLMTLAPQDVPAYEACWSSTQVLVERRDFIGAMEERFELLRTIGRDTIIGETTNRVKEFRALPSGELFAMGIHCFDLAAKYGPSDEQP